ncbi:hypothetical protein BGZ65_008541, partial [Modicella reniformis]
MRITSINTDSDSDSKSNGHRDGSSSFPSPTSPKVVDQLQRQYEDLSHRFPNGTPLSSQDRISLEKELSKFKALSEKAQKTYDAVHATIQRYQQQMLSTHAQVAAAKQALLQARKAVHTRRQQ